MSTAPTAPGPDEPDLHALIEASRGGDPDAFAKIVALYHARVRSYVAGYVRDKTLADDICQEAFVSAYRDLPRYRHEAPLSVWLLGVARHRALDHLKSEVRRHARQARVLDAAVAELGVRQLEAEDGVLGKREREILALRRCVDKLPEASAEIVRAHYYSALSAAEIAHTLGRAPGAVRMMLLRVRQALRDCIERSLAREAGE